MLKGEKIKTYGFQDVVFPKELEDIRERVVVRGDDADTMPRGEGLPDFESLFDPGAKPSNVLLNVLEGLRDEDNETRWQDDPAALHKGLVGLAFSGGGIRSATYNLGVMQALKNLGLFKCVDYLSTVSGGGYIGSCISATLASINKLADADTLREPINQIFDHTQGKPEPNIYRHLRDNATYLAPDGFLDILRIPMLLFRGIVVNLLVILPYLLLAAIVTLIIKPTKESLNEHVFSWLGLEDSFVATKVLLLFLLFLFAAYPFIHMYHQRQILGQGSTWKTRNRAGWWLSFLIATIVVAAFVELQPYAIGEFITFREHKGAIAFGIGAFGSAVVVFFAEKLLPKLSKFYGRLAFYLLGFLGFASFWLFYLWLCSLGYDSGVLPQMQDVWWVSIIPTWWPEVLSDVPGGVESLPGGVRSLVWTYGFLGTVLWLYTFFTVDVNFTGIHKFYRDRLSKAYIVGVKPPGDGVFSDQSLSENTIEHTDDVKLSALNTRHGPYHLINALLNLNETEERYKTGRHGDFFIFSKKYIGGKLTGYVETREMEAVSSNVDLATAMAISGAAAAPNMGKITIKPLLFILGMLNVRMNYWLPNPAKLWRRPEGLKKLPAGAVRRVGPVFLLMELFGLNSVKNRSVNLSDGGHLENLGAYELIRRQCRLIIVGDGESDAAFKFQGLADLIRMVQIDMGIKIEVDGLDEIRRGEQHHAIGTIRYPNGRIGKMIYLKSSLLGDNSLMATLGQENYVTSPYRDDNLMFDQNAYIAYYKALNSAFPHQSTGDQFFDEAQFECYRALGYAVAMDVLRAKR